MLKQDYLAELQRSLRRLPKEERENALGYYTEYLDDAEDPDAAMERLGPPKALAASILTQCADKALEQSKGRSGLSTLWVVLLAVFASPLALPLLLCAALVAFVLLLTAGLICLSLLLSAVAIGLAGLLSLGIGIAACFIHWPTGLLYSAGGLILMGVGLAGSYGSLLLGRLWARGIARLIAKFLSRKETHHEENE